MGEPLNLAHSSMSRSIYTQPKYSALQEWNRAAPTNTSTPWAVSQWQKSAAPPALGAFAPPNGFAQQFMKQQQRRPATQVQPPPPPALSLLNRPATQTAGRLPIFTTPGAVPPPPVLLRAQPAPARLSAGAFSPLPMAKKNTLRAGRGHMCAVGDMVDVTYVGWLAGSDAHSGRFDEGANFQFVLGAGEVIPGWDSAFVGMLEGERARLFVPSVLGYGVRGLAPKIPPNADLQFEVQINGVVCAPPAVMRAVVRANAGANAGATSPGPKPAVPAAAPAATAPPTPFDEQRLRELIPSPPKPRAQLHSRAGPPGSAHGSTHGRAINSNGVQQPPSAIGGAPPPAFTASDRFTGPRPGQVFKGGPSGLGYYRDPASEGATTMDTSVVVDPAAAPKQATTDDGSRLGTASLTKSVRFDASVQLPPPTASTDPRKYHDRAVAEIMQRKMQEQTTALQQAFPFGVPGQGAFMRQGFKYL